MVGVGRSRRPGRRGYSAPARARVRAGRRCRPGCRGSCCWCLARRRASRRWSPADATAAGRTRPRRASGGGCCRRRSTPSRRSIALLERAVGSGARRGAAEAAGARRAGAALHRAARRQSRAAGLSRAAHRRARHRCPPRSGVRAGRRSRDGAIWCAGRPARTPKRGAPRCSICAGVARDHLADAVAARAGGAARRPSPHADAVCARRVLARRDAPAVRSAGGADRGCSTS